MLHSLLLILILNSVFGYYINDDKKLAYRSSNSNFDFFMMTEQYPAAICQVSNDKVENSCVIPDGSSRWTIHGLWPNRDDGTYPQFCRVPDEIFKISSVDSILDQLQKNWPNMIPEKSFDSLWKHEWEKHGTCAESVPGFTNEFQYFNSTLYAYSLYNIEQSLRDYGIVGSRSQSYSASDIENAITNSFSAPRTIQLHCVKDPESHEWMLSDVRFCITKDLLIRDCPSGYSPFMMMQQNSLASTQPCPRNGILYLPFEEINSGNLTLSNLRIFETASNCSKI